MQNDVKYNAKELEAELDNLGSLGSQHKNRDFWDYTKKIVDMFKSLNVPPTERESLWRKYSSICQKVKQESEEYATLAKSNATKLNIEIDNFRYKHMNPNMNPMAPPTTSKYNYKEFWQHAKEINENMKKSKLFKSEREQLWKKYQDICNIVSRQQDSERVESGSNHDRVIRMLDEAYKKADFTDSPEGLKEAKEMLNTILEYMRKNRLFGKDREECWNFWCKASDRVSSRRTEIQESNYVHAKERVSFYANIAYDGNAYDALEGIKDVQQNLKGKYMSKTQRDEIYGTMDSAWNKAIGRIKEMKDERTKKQEEYMRKQREWRERSEGHISRWEGNVEKAEGAISKIQANISKLEGQASSAKTTEFEARVRGWISENYSQIEDIRNSIRDWESKISSLRSKLNG